MLPANRKYPGVAKRTGDSSTERKSPHHPGLKPGQGFLGHRNTGIDPNCPEPPRSPTSFPCTLTHEQAHGESDVEFLTKTGWAEGTTWKHTILTFLTDMISR